MKNASDPARDPLSPLPGMLWDGSVSSLPAVLLEDVPFLVWVKDTEGRYVYINKAYRNLRKVRSEDRVGLTDEDIYPPAVAAKFRSADLAVMTTRQPVLGEDVYSIEIHGFSAVYATEKRPLFSPAGCVTGIYGISFDVTEKKAYDERMSRQKRLLEALHETSVELMKQHDIAVLLRTILKCSAEAVGAPVGFMNFADPVENVMKIRHSWGKDLQIPAGYVVHRGQSLVGLVWDLGKTVVLEDYQAWERKTSYDCFSYLRAIVGIPVFTGPEVVAVVTLAHIDPSRHFDETDVVALEQFSALASVALENARLFDAANTELRQRRESEALYRSLIQQSSDAIVLVDPFTRNLLQANKRYWELTGYTEEDLSHLTIYDVISDEKRWIDQNIDIVLPQNRSIPIENRRFRRKDGVILEMERSAVMVSIAGKEVIMVVGRDVSERRHIRLLEFLHETTMDIVGHLNQKEVLESIVKRTIRLIDAPAGYCALLREGSPVLQPAAVVGLAADFFAGAPRIDSGLTGKVWASGRAVVVNDYRCWEDRLSDPRLDRITATAVFPLKNSAGEVIGTLAAMHFDPEKRIRMDDFACLEELSQLASLALDSARLYNTARLEIATRAEIELQIRQAYEKLDETYDTTLEGWARALDMRDCETEGHSRRVASVAVQMAKAMNIPPERHVHIWRGALLHDIGKLGIADAILLKPGPLTEDEWQLMRLHPIYGYDWLQQIEYLRPALAIPRHHHERWDGTGYPDRLRGEEIPLEARIFAPIDVWDALSSNRPYRRSWPDDKIREHIRALAGSHFDPEVVKLFLALPPESLVIQESGLLRTGR